MLPYYLKKIRWRLLESSNRREHFISKCGPVVSFTFDDFPQSALHTGGKILKDYGFCGTYYASMGLMGKAYSTGCQFTDEDVLNLLEDGHELGCHTYSHLSCRTSSAKFYNDSVKGKKAISKITGKDTPQSFSYPQGHVTFQTKRLIEKEFVCSRGVFPGINISPIDLNLLRANSLYSGDFDIEAIKRLFIENAQRNGWLIFFTHDVSGNPSPFGCTPEEFESVVDLASKMKNLVLPVISVVQQD